MKIYLIRHGETENNIAGLTQGWHDSKLTDKGVMQAKMVGQYLKDIPFYRAYSGDSERQWKTAQYILEENQLNQQNKLSVVKTSSFREMGFGRYELSNFTKMATPFLEENELPLSGYMQDPRFDLFHLFRYVAEHDEQGTVEHPEHVFERFGKGIDRFVKDRDDNILLVSSAGAIVCFLNYLFPNLEEPVKLPNGSITILEYTQGQYRLLEVGKTVIEAII